ncbi:MAG: LPS export ABC transporter periplasmic protein LptC [Rickettsiales bacterium]|jgi:lipopolysaccharide export system protein LptC|nr:LPS export ABC transporter periplasmic protein LptC [Rickettsiales bacterium]
MISFVKHEASLAVRRIRKAYRQLAGHSRAVFLLKILLPSVAALFVGIALVLPRFASRVRVKVSIPKITGVADISFTMEEGSFRGQGDDGAVFSANMKTGFEAKAAPVVEFTRIEGNITLKDASRIDISARAGKFFKDKKLFEMRGSVRISDDAGSKMTTEEANVDVATSEIYGASPVVATTDFGQIIGEGFSFKRGEKYVFTGRVNGRVDSGKISK